MGKLLSLITPLHKKSKRDYIARMLDDKIKCMKIAKKYGYDYWDGDRRYGYGGYKYDGRWRIVAEKLIKIYKLNHKSKILDVGCGKGFLLYELTQLLPGIKVTGLDISRYALIHAKEEVKKYLFWGDAANKNSYKKFNNKEFDLVFSNTTLHNLPISKLRVAIPEIERVGKNKFICLESYRNDAELFNVECWALTCEAFFDKENWIWLYKHFGYTGDYEFIYFE